MEIENEAHDSVNIIHLEQNMHQGGARNTALSYINGKYFLFLDSDDTLNNEACKTLYDHAEIFEFLSRPIKSKETLEMLNTMIKSIFP